MKKFILIMLLFACFAGTVQASLTYGQTFYNSNKRYLHSASSNDPLYQFIGEVDGIFSGTATGTITNLLFDNTITANPTSTEGRLYYNTTSNLFVFYNGSSWVDIEANTGGLSLDGSYGLGTDVTVDNGTSTWTATDGADNIVLAIVQADTGSTVAQTITSAGTGALLSFDSNGTGADILGSDSTWTITKAGAATLVGITNTGAIAHSGADITITGTAANIEFDVSRDMMHVLDDAVIGIGGATTAAGDVTLSHDGSDFSILSAIADEGMLIGGVAAGFDITYAFETAGQIRTDYDGDFLNLTDDMDLRFGTGASADGDFILSSDSSNVLTLEQVVASTGTMVIGASGVDIPIIWNGETAAAEVTLTGDTVLVDGIDVTMQDADSIIFGDSTDGSIQWNATLLKLEAATTVAGTALQIETTDGGIHLNADGATNGDILIDAADVMTFTSADTKIFDGATAETWVIEGTANTEEATVVFTDPTADVTWTFPTAAADTFAVMASTLVTNAPEIANSVSGGTNQLIFEGATADDFETIITPTDATADATLVLPDDSGDIAYTPTGGTTYGAGAGALPVTHAYIAYTSVGGAEALTLADGSNGQILTIAHVTDGGNGVVTPATAAGWTSVDLADDGDMITLVFVDTVGWAVMGTAGVAAPPALTVP
jgi:hypothetical protein